jgi:hypothetical protein
MHKPYSVRLADKERRQGAELSRPGQAAASKLRQANILLNAEADGPAWTEERRAESGAVSVQTVRGVRPRVVAQGLEAARHRKPPAQPSRAPRVDGAGEARRLALRGRAPPAGQARWTRQRLAAPAVAWEMVEAISPETGRQVRKQCVEPAAAAEVGHAARAQWGVCGA